MAETPAVMRVDRFLWWSRISASRSFARSRSLAQALIAAGHIRLDGRRVSRASCAVHAGQTLVLPVGERIEVLRLLSLPRRRGPASEAQGHYLRLGPDAAAAPNAAISAQGKAVAPEGAGEPME
jgi:ribosome-associated heat shock protein Hsp15